MNGRLMIAVAVLATLLTGCKNNKNSVTYDGPALKAVIFPGDYPDPSIMRDGNDFYMTHSCFTYYPGLLIWHSTDLLNWEPVTRAVQGQDYSIFAPELCKVDGKYYIYYPTSDNRNFVVVADRIEGPWSEPIELDVVGIDPGHVVDEQGNRYLYSNDGYMVQLSADGLHALGNNKNTKAYDGWQYPSDWVTEGFWLESPKLTKHGEWYYLITAEGGTAGPETSHMVVVARSKNVTGPWENSPYNPMIHTYSADEEWWSKGHGTLIDDADGNWYIVYHAYRNSFHTLGRSTIVESVRWTEDEWPVAVQEDGALWDKGGLQEDYSYLRDYDNPLFWAKWEPGVDGIAGFEDIKDGTLMTTTAIDTAYTVQAEFKLNGNAKAGLYLFYNEAAFFGIRLGADSAAAGRLFIKIENRSNTASLWTSNDGTEWTMVEEGQNVSTYHHNTYKGFFALRPAYLTTPGAELVSFAYTPMN